MQKNVRDRMSSQDSASALAADSLLWEALAHLQLNIAQTAALCGISVRQLGYWTKQNYVIATGRGARRMYDLSALRRILTIQEAMADGASLRQALRALPPPDAPQSPPSPAPGALGPRESPRAVSAPVRILASEEADLVASDLLALFVSGGHTRDSAAGLAVKIGHAFGEVQTVAETLSGRGLLRKIQSQGETIFQYAGENTL